MAEMACETGNSRCTTSNGKGSGLAGFSVNECVCACACECVRIFARAGEQEPEVENVREHDSPLMGSEEVTEGRLSGELVCVSSNLDVSRLRRNGNEVVIAVTESLHVEGKKFLAAV